MPQLPTVLGFQVSLSPWLGGIPNAVCKNVSILALGSLANALARSSGTVMVTSPVR